MKAGVLLLVDHPPSKTSVAAFLRRRAQQRASFRDMQGYGTGLKA